MSNEPSAMSYPRVCMVSPLYHPSLGGVGRQAVGLAEYLHESGIRVSVICRDIKNIPPWEPVAGMFIKKVRTIGSEKHDLEAKSVMNVLISLSFCFGLMFALIRNRREYDIAHFHGAGLPLIFNILPLKIMRKKVVAKVAGAKMNREAGSFKGKFLFIGNIFVRMLKKVDMFAAISSEIRIDLIKDGFDKNKIFEISNFIKKEDFYPELDIKKRESFKKRVGIAGGEKNILCSGRLVPTKRLDVLLKAVSAVVKMRNDFRVIILGQGAALESLKKMALDLNIKDYVLFKGFVPNMLDYLQIADIYVLTSEVEGMPNSLLEAMACRLPVVATKIGGVVDIIENGRNGILIPPGDVSSLRDAILFMLENPDERERLAVEAYRTIRENYCIEAVASRYAGLYRSLLGAV